MVTISPIVTSSPQKTCFFVGPIGEEGSDVRKHSDDVLELIVKPAVTECGYTEPLRADYGAKRMVRFEIIERLLNDDLVIADLT